MKLIFPNDQGGICIITSTGELSLDIVAKKDVPFGAPYLIVDNSFFPEDRTFRDAWEADFSNPDGYGLGPQRWFIEQAEAEIAFINSHHPTSDPAIQKTRQDRVVDLQALIGRMKAEVLQIEGVQL
ncbi:MAG TPA: hypothetical protein VFV43_04555 [Limnobacter sp.]|nr:hypothetical protein [Limnobacter sp.]